MSIRIYQNLKNLILKNVSLNIVKGYHLFDIMCVKVVVNILDNLLYSDHETLTAVRIFLTKTSKTHGL